MNVTMLKPDVYEQYNCYYAEKNYPLCVAWSFEAFVVAESDEIAQLHHDLEDAIRGNAMSRQEVYYTVKKNLSCIMNDEDKNTLNKMNSKKIDDETYIVLLSKVVVNTLVNQIIKMSLVNLEYVKKRYSVNEKTKVNFFHRKQFHPRRNKKGYFIRFF